MTRNEKSVPDARQKAAWSAEIARSVELKHVVLVRSQTTTLKLDLTAKVHNDASVVAKVAFPEQAKGPHRTFVVEAEVALKASSRAEPAQPLYSVSAAYALVYLLPKPLELPEEAFTAFAELNGMVNAYPYLREYVQATVQRMGFAPVVLPVFRAGEGRSRQR